MFAMEIQLYRVLIVVCRAGHDNDTRPPPVNSCQSYTTHSDGKMASLYTLASPPVERIGTININLIDAGESCQLTWSHSHHQPPQLDVLCHVKYPLD